MGGYQKPPRKPDRPPVPRKLIPYAGYESPARKPRMWLNNLGELGLDTGELMTDEERWAARIRYSKV